MGGALMQIRVALQILLYDGEGHAALAVAHTVELVLGGVAPHADGSFDDGFEGGFGRGGELLFEGSYLLFQLANTVH